MEVGWGRAGAGQRRTLCIPMPQNQPSHPAEPIRLRFADAASWLHARAVATRSAFVIGVTGPVGSGKTTLARAVAALAAPDSLVLSTDHYLPDYDGIRYEERDEPHHADLPLLAQHLIDLRAGRTVNVPEWSFHTHSRVGSTRLNPAPLIVCEGIHALHATVRESLDLRVFVHAGASTRWSRWRAIEERGERGWGVDVAKAFFDQVAEPTFDRHAPDYLRYADVVVENDG